MNSFSRFDGLPAVRTTTRCLALSVILLAGLLHLAGGVGQVRLYAFPSSHSFQIPVRITQPLQSIPVTVNFSWVDVSPPATYKWYTTVNSGSTTPNQQTGVVPVQKAMFTYEPGTVPLDYKTVSINLTIKYSPYPNPSVYDSYIVTFSPEYKVDVLSDRGTASGSSFQRSGAYVRPTVTPTEVIESGLTKYRLVGWSVNVSGRAPFTIGPTDSAKVTQVTTFTAIWEQDYLVQFAGLGNSTASWHPKGSRLTFTSPQWVEECQGRRKALDGFNVSGTIVRSSSCTLTVSSPLYVTTTYHEEAYVQVLSERGTVAGSGWYRIGSSVSPEVSPTIVNDTSLSRWVFAGWNSTLPVIASSPLTLVAVWAREYRVKIDTYYGGAIDGWYMKGSRIKINASEPRDLGNRTKSLFSGWSDGVQEMSRELNVDAPISLEEKRVLYYQIALEGLDPQIVVSGDFYENGWARVGSTVHITAVVEFTISCGARLVFSGFRKPVDTNESEITYVVREPVEVSASWTKFFLVSAKGVRAGVEGAGWYQEGTQVDLRVPNETVYESCSTRWRFQGWNCSFPILVNAPVCAEALWACEYLVNVSSLFGSVSGAGWHLVGSTANLTVSPTELTLANGSRATFSGWIVNGLTVESNVLLVDEPKDCMAVWTLVTPPHPPSPPSPPSPPPPAPPPSPPPSQPPPPPAPQPGKNGSSSLGGDNGTDSTSDRSPTEEENQTSVRNEDPQQDTRSTTHVFRLIIETEYSSCNGSGSHAEGQTIAVGLAESVVVLSESERMRFIGWANANGTTVFSTPNLNITIIGDLTLLAIWRREVSVNGQWLWANATIVLNADPEAFSADGKTLNKFRCWVLENGSKVYSEQIALPAGEVGKCCQVRDTYYLVTFNIYGTQYIQFTVSTYGVHSVQSATNGDSIWLPSGSTVRFILPLNVCAPQFPGLDSNAQDGREIVVTSPLNVVASHSEIMFESDSSNLMRSDMQAYINGLPLVVLPITAACALMIAFKRLRAFRASRGTTPSKPATARWASLEGYLSAISKGKKRLRFWLG